MSTAKRSDILHSKERARDAEEREKENQVWYQDSCPHMALFKALIDYLQHNAS